MLIALQRVENEQALKDALASPIKREDCAFYVTEMPEAARALAQRKLPCIFLEGSAQETKKGAGVYGVDLILQGDNMRGKPGGTPAGVQPQLSDGRGRRRIGPDVSG